MIEAKVAQRARARLAARPAGGRSSPATARPTTRPRAPARPGPTSCSSCRGAARCARRTPRSTRRRRASCWPSRDANALWEPRRAARARRAASPTSASATPAGRSRFVNDGGTNQEGLYWRYEMAMRALRVPAARRSPRGNGAIYAVRPEAYLRVDPVMGHDLVASRSTSSSAAGGPCTCPRRARPRRWSRPIEGEFARKRRMMSHAWPIVLRGGHARSRAAIRRSTRS